MNAQCYAKPSFYTTLDKTPVNTRFPPMAYNIRQNSREHLPPPFPLGSMLHRTRLSPQHWHWGEGGGGKVFTEFCLMLSLRPKLGTLCIEQQQGRRSVSLTCYPGKPIDWRWPSKTRIYLNLHIAVLKNKVFRHVSDAHMRNKSRPHGPPKGFLCVLSLFLKPLRLKRGFLMKILMSRFCSVI